MKFEDFIKGYLHQRENSGVVPGCQANLFPGENYISPEELACLKKDILKCEEFTNVKKLEIVSPEDLTLLEEKTKIKRNLITRKWNSGANLAEEVYINSIQLSCVMYEPTEPYKETRAVLIRLTQDSIK